MPFFLLFHRGHHPRKHTHKRASHTKSGSPSSFALFRSLSPSLFLYSYVAISLSSPHIILGEIEDACLCDRWRWRWRGETRNWTKGAAEYSEARWNRRKGEIDYLIARSGQIDKKIIFEIIIPKWHHNGDKHRDVNYNRVGRLVKKLYRFFCLIPLQ